MHGGTASRTLRGVEGNEGTTAGTADSVGYVIRGMECGENGGRLQADKTRRRTEIDQECHGTGGTIVPHRGSEEAFVFTYFNDELCTFKHYDSLLGDDI